MSFDFTKIFRELFDIKGKSDLYDPIEANEVQNEIKNIIDNETGRQRIENFFKKP